MELSQSRPYGAEGRKPTRDFLSLYSHPTAQQDPRPPCQGNYLKTHDFLQPLEKVGKGCAKEEKVSAAETTAAAAPAPAPAPAPVEHVLPGGIGTYSISHVSSYLNPVIRAPKPEEEPNNSDRNEEASFCSSYGGGGSGFTLWDESKSNKGKTGKENIIRNTPAVLDSAASRAGHWASSSSERPSHSSSNNHRGNFSSPSSSQPSGMRSQSFMDMIKSAKGSSSHEDEIDEEEHFALKKEISSSTITPNELRVKVDGKSSDQKANTPRSKHSATEQRRRSKINDRFQMLRGLIPHGDQKRDKASFLLEVIEYIQFLQDKVQKYEGPFQGWNNEPPKLMPWRSNNRIGESFDRPGPTAALVFPTKFEEKPIPVVSPVSLVESDKGTKAFPMMSLQPNFISPVRNPGGAVRLPSDVGNAPSQPRSQACQTRSRATIDRPVVDDQRKEDDMAIEGGTISISSAYSKGLLSTLTQALQSSGVDLSQANVSVQIELGKRAKNCIKDDEISPGNHGVKHSRPLTADDSDHTQKKLKTTKN